MQEFLDIWIFKEMDFQIFPKRTEYQSHYNQPNSYHVKNCKSIVTLLDPPLNLFGQGVCKFRCEVRCCLSYDCKFLLLRLLSLSSPVPLSLVKKWSPTEESSNMYLWRLKQWNILQGKEQIVWISPEFKNSMFSLFLSGVAHGQNEVFSLFQDKYLSTNPPNISSLCHYQRTAWEAFLGLLVRVDGRQDDTTVPNQVMIELFLEAGLIKFSNTESDSHGDSEDGEKTKIRKTGKGTTVVNRNQYHDMKITHYGFKFLLMPKRTQIWTIVAQYLQYGNTNKVSSVIEDLQLLFRLSFMAQDSGSEIIHGYDMGTMNVKQKSILKDLLSGLGLVFIQKEGNKSLFYLTPSARYLLYSVEYTVTDKVDFLGMTQSLSLFVESNHRVYAYTDSELGVAILSLFIRIQEKLPNFIIGILDHGSCQAAFRNGITSDQIIAFLTNHAHPNMRYDAMTNHRSNILPATLIDQIKLWELEQHRISLQPAVLFHQFAHTPDYERALQYANQIQCVLLAVPEKRVLLTTPEGYEKLHAWLTQI